MSSPKDAMPHVEVDDPAAAFHKLEDFTRKILAVPKKETDRQVLIEKRGSRKKRG